jgi:hypothetical protein
LGFGILHVETEFYRTETSYFQKKTAILDCCFLSKELCTTTFDA